jgi:hypothetical protein
MQTNVINIPVSIHFVNDLNITKSGQRLTPWLTEREIRDVVLPEVNRIWKPAGIVWNIQIVDVAKTATSKSEGVARYLEGAARGEDGGSNPELVRNLLSIVPSTDDKVKSIHVCVLPFIGSTLQGLAIPKRQVAFVGQWTDKPSQGRRAPIRCKVIEDGAFVQGSFSRTLAHELGHLLSLQHPDRAARQPDALMGGGRPGNALTQQEIDMARKAALKLYPQTELKIATPLDYQVVQRNQRGKGNVTISGQITAALLEEKHTLEVRRDGGDWKRTSVRWGNATFTAQLELPAGGWYALDVRFVGPQGVLATTSVAHVGVGDIFVVAGQSNSANHGEERQRVQSGKVVTFDGSKWQLANDPQPGASGDMGSFMPPLGDALVARFGVPIGFIACGIGASSVREWLPDGSTFPNPPTIEGRVRRLPDGSWESKGEAYAMFISRMSDVGKNGFRAVLWHQGESDANQADTSRTLAGNLYQKYLTQLIQQSRKDIGWNAPWFVAQASYHVPGDEGSDDIRKAQAAVWKDRIALQGPDSDAVKGNYRDSGGKGVHFSGPGLREHAARWFEKIAPWLAKQ